MGLNGEWAMVNGESSTILLLLNFYANSSSTLSVFSYPLSIIHFTIHHSPLTIAPSSGFVDQ
jgi:hypothetical protein